MRRNIHFHNSLFLASVASMHVYAYNNLCIHNICVNPQDILVTQSEYVKEELIHLRQSLQELEDRAGTIETDIRIVMSEGAVCIEYVWLHYSVHTYTLVEEQHRGFYPQDVIS